MEITSIEKLDRLRYDLIKWFTIGWATWFGGFILHGLIDNKILLGLIILIGSIGWIIFSISLIQFIKLGKMVRSNAKLESALNDELILHNRNRSFTIGFWTFGLVTCIFCALSMFIDIPALIACALTLYIGILSTLISSLIYNKD